MILIVSLGFFQCPSEDDCIGRNLVFSSSFLFVFSETDSRGHGDRVFNVSLSVNRARFLLLQHAVLVGMIMQPKRGACPQEKERRCGCVFLVTVRGARQTADHVRCKHLRSGVTQLYVKFSMYSTYMPSTLPGTDRPTCPWLLKVLD